jgi:hypothetical protein
MGLTCNARTAEPLPIKSKIHAQNELYLAHISTRAVSGLL